MLFWREATAGSSPGHTRCSGVADRCEQDVRISLQPSCTLFSGEAAAGTSPGPHQVLGRADRCEQVRADLPAAELHVILA